MIKKTMIIGCLLITTGFAAFELQTVNPSSIALGNVISLYPYSLNPAAQTEAVGKYLRFDYSRIFSIKGLDYYEVQAGWTSIRKRSYGAVLRSFGNPVYQEKTIVFNHARRDSDGAVGLTIGAKCYISEQMQFAVLFQNVNSPSLYDRSNRLPECFSAGLSYTPLPRIDWCLELFKDTEFPFSTRTGVRIKTLSCLDLMVGAQLNPDRFSGGLTLHWKQFRFDAAFLHHLVLPYTIYCGFGICY
jgi:hypothetical protein